MKIQKIASASIKFYAGMAVLAVISFLVLYSPFSCSLAHSADTSQADALPEKIELHPEVKDPGSFWSLAPEELDDLAKLHAKMGPEEKLAQLFMMSYGGDQPTSLLYSWIRKRGLGGIKIFGWNAEDTSRLAAAVKAIQDASENSPFAIPAFIATDQEGGWIRHVKGNTSITPGNMAIGASAWPSDAYYSAYYIASELSALGINMNFAPTVDLASRPDSAIIGPRAFSANPMETGILAAAWARGCMDAGIMPTAKHYPGHGDTELDSHGVLPVINIDMYTLWNRELLPYRILASEGIPGIMSGHLAYPQISGKTEAASLSSLFINDILRKKIGYKGLIITDDLLMTGAGSSGGLADSCEKAIRAGNDILMFSKTLAMDDPAWIRLLRLYENDSGFAARVDESSLRVLEAKKNWLLSLGRDGIRPKNNPGNYMQTRESQEFFAEQAIRSSTSIGQFFPRPENSGQVLAAGPFSDFLNEAKACLPESASFRFSYQPAEKADPLELADFKARLARAKAAIVCVANPAGADFAQAVKDAGKTLYIVSVLSPSYSLPFADCADITAVYSYSKDSFKAAFAVIMEEVEAPGILPLQKDQ
ncbi:glycoside hydrolase family 3 protein [Spirochaetota bacterium]